MAEQENIWPKSITVDKRIVKILSESTYNNFPQSLKELITNSYDADAARVDIIVDPGSETVTVLDNGKGMSEKEFEYYLRIAGAKREKESGLTPSGRQIIGKFGVGFLSIFPFFKTFTVESSKKNSDEVLIATIPCYQYFSSKDIEISQIPILGEVRIDETKRNLNYTVITLTGFTELAREFFYPDQKIKYKKYSIRSKDFNERIKWKLEEDLPLQYKDERFNKLIQFYSPNLKFRVYLNGLELLRRTYASQLLEITNQVLPFDRSYVTDELSIIETEIKAIGKIKFQYFILTDKIALRPYEARGLKIRNRNAGVGERQFFNLGSEVKGGRSRLQWLSGEILVLEGLNELISVSRDNFYFDPDYDDLKSFMIERLSYHSNRLEDESEYKNELGNTKIRDLSIIEEAAPITPAPHSDSQLAMEFPEPDQEIKISRDEFNLKSQGLKLLLGKPKQKNIRSEKISKGIEIMGKEYSVKISKWDYKEDFFPACKLIDDVVIVNKSYPLFSGVKYTDLFIKMHLLFLHNLNDGTLNNSSYEKTMEEILQFYKDYL